MKSTIGCMIGLDESEFNGHHTVRTPGSYFVIKYTVDLVGTRGGGEDPHGIRMGTNSQPGS